jgi:hypothetical protein
LESDQASGSNEIEPVVRGVPQVPVPHVPAPQPKPEDGLTKPGGISRLIVIVPPPVAGCGVARPGDREVLLSTIAAIVYSPAASVMPPTVTFEGM